MPEPEWLALRTKIQAAVSHRTAAKVFSTKDAKPKRAGSTAKAGATTKNGSIYLYGLGLASGAIPSELISKLTALAMTPAVGKKNKAGKKTKHDITNADRVFFEQQANEWMEATSHPMATGEVELPVCLEAILWASSLVPLTEVLPQELWWKLLSHLLQLRADAALELAPTSGKYLLFAGELGITLAWRLGSLAACDRPRQASLDAVANFIDGEADSIDDVLQNSR